MRDPQTAELIAFQLLRLEEVDRPGEVPLEDVRVQDALRKRRTENLSSRRIDRSLMELFDGAYVWPPPEPAAEAEAADAPNAAP